MKQLVGIILCLFCSVSNAAWVVDYTGKDNESESTEEKPSQRGMISKQTLLLDKSVEWATIVGIEKCGSNLLVSGSGVDVPMSLALKMLTPSGWKVFADDDVTLDRAFVTWRSGAVWTKILADSAEINKLKMSIDCASKVVSISSSPDLGTLSANKEFSESMAEIPEAEFESIPAPLPEPVVSDVQAAQINANGSANTQSNSPGFGRKVEPLPTAESLQSYFQRYADNYGYARVAYRVKSNSIDNLLRKSALDGKAKSFADVLRINKLIQLNGIDVVTNESVMVITNDDRAIGSSDLLVFPVSPGMLSENSIQLAKAIGWKLGWENTWPLDVDYKVSYGYDIVMIEPVDAFSELFAKYPIQAQLVIGSKVVSVVKRNSPNRTNF